MPICDLAELVSLIPDGAKIAIPPSRSGVAMAATRAIIAAGARDLHLVAIPTSGIQADILIGAGCVATMESAGVTLDEFGQAPRFVNAVKSGEIRLMDSTCPAIMSALQAGEKGIPFMPMRGLIGSDLLTFRPDYRVIENPMAEGADPIVTLPAIVPDIALFHAPMADQNGNVWIGKMRELMTMAHAAKVTLVTVEKIFDGDLMADPLRAPATIPALYITKIAKAGNGAWPLGLEGVYDIDKKGFSTYAKAAKTSDGFADYLDFGTT
ncbi:MAG: CoA synthetase [Alphaproteobacteria bacterium]|nr:CoA synthetase [Alphaproteobacteria bacterium]